MSSKPDENHDFALGMDRPILRRDFLGATLLASGGLRMGGASPAELLAVRDEWTGCGGVGD